MIAKQEKKTCLGVLGLTKHTWKCKDLMRAASGVVYVLELM